MFELLERETNLIRENLTKPARVIGGRGEASWKRREWEMSSPASLAFCPSSQCQKSLQFAQGDGGGGHTFLNKRNIFEERINCPRRCLEN